SSPISSTNRDKDLRRVEVAAGSVQQWEVCNNVCNNSKNPRHLSEWRGVLSLRRAVDQDGSSLPPIADRSCPHIPASGLIATKSGRKWAKKPARLDAVGRRCRSLKTGLRRATRPAQRYNRGVTRRLRRTGHAGEPCCCAALRLLDAGTGLRGRARTAEGER